MKRDNSTFKQKAALRKATMKRVENPVIMETHGGTGRLFKVCYRSVKSGVVFEKHPGRGGLLAYQRPTWAVYEADCVAAIAAGAGAHLEVNLLDLDPWGDPWPAIEAFFNSERPRAEKLWVVVNDGLRQKVRMGGAWSVGTLQPMVAKYGNDLHRRYLEICREMMETQAARAGYTLTAWAGYYCGHIKMMTHYLAELTTPQPSFSSSSSRAL